MPKISKGRLDGRGRLHAVWGMNRYTATELHEMADDFEAEAKNPNSEDDPKWSRRWASRIRKLAKQKEKSLEHKTLNSRKY